MDIVEKVIEAAMAKARIEDVLIAPFVTVTRVELSELFPKRVDDAECPGCNSHQCECPVRFTT